VHAWLTTPHVRSRGARCSGRAVRNTRADQLAAPCLLQQARLTLAQRCATRVQQLLT
jgi:hypothetical protein